MMDSSLSSGVRRRGFNLIEAAIVLGVVGLVIGGIWVAAASYNRNLKARQTMDGVMLIANKVDRNFSHLDVGNTPLVLTTAQLQAMSEIPSGWHVNADGTLDSPAVPNIIVGISQGSALELVQKPYIYIAGNGGYLPSSDPSTCKAFGNEAVKALAVGGIVGLEFFDDVMDNALTSHPYNGTFDTTLQVGGATAGHNYGLPDPI